MARWQAAIQEVGPYPHGDLRPVGAVCHRTYGSRQGDLAVARGARRGIGFHFYVPKAPPGPFQFYDTRTEAWHAAGANGDTVGIEVESLNNDDPMTPWQIGQLGLLVRWLAEVEGIGLVHVVPPRTLNHRGFIDHAAVAGSDHGDLWHPHEWARILGATPPSPLPSELPPMQMILRYPADNALHFFYVADGGELWHAWWPRSAPFARKAENLLLAANPLADIDPRVQFDGQPEAQVDPDTGELHVVCDRQGANGPMHFWYTPKLGWAVN